MRKVIHLNHADVNGGAARAAYRLHQALLSAGMESAFWANKAAAGDWTVHTPTAKMEKAWARMRPHLGSLATRLLRTDNPIIHSPSIFPSYRVKALNASDADILHLHWVQNEMLSIADIGRIRKPVVWTLHDMWAFCGAEHVAWDERWRHGYRRDNRPAHESRFDLNRWTWERKLKQWKNPIHLVTPSKWLAECVKDSAIMRYWPVSVIPNCLDMESWTPMDQRLARTLLHLPQDKSLLLFGTSGSNSAHHKGFDLLKEALNHLRGEVQDLELVIFGQLAPRQPLNLGFNTHYVGHLHDEVSMRLLYSASDALVIPSRIDNLPNTGIEAMACGRPVVAFNAGGLQDIISHKANGYLAAKYIVEDLAEGIKWTLQHDDKQELRSSARNKALLSFDARITAKKYKQIYEQVLSTL